MTSVMTPSRPYLLRAFYQWIIDNQLTPYIVVEANVKGVEVPQQYVENGRIILNISPASVQQLDLSDNWITFSARFAGVPHHIMAPMRAVSGIYAKENGRGMVFKEDEYEDAPPDTPPSSSDSKKDERGKGGKGGRAHLTVVK